jgi:hypothetical protein
MPTIERGGDADGWRGSVTKTCAMRVKRVSGGGIIICGSGSFLCGGSFLSSGFGTAEVLVWVVDAVLVSYY